MSNESRPFIHSILYTVPKIQILHTYDDLRDTFTTTRVFGHHDVLFSQRLKNDVRNSYIPSLPFTITKHLKKH